MKTAITTKILSIVLALMVAFSAFPAFAADEGNNIEVIFEDVTVDLENFSTLAGEAKILVSVKGAAGNVKIAQTALNFSGDLKYKSVQFLKGTNNPPECFLYSPNAALANAESKKIIPSIISLNGIEFDEVTPLFVLTFAGNPGDKVKLQLIDSENTFCTVDGADISPYDNNPEEENIIEEIEVAAASEAKEAVKASVVLKLETVDTIIGGLEEDGYNGTDIHIKIESEQTPGHGYYTVLNNISVSDGGNRDATERIPTFVVESMLLKDDTYTVEISAPGYVTYKAEGIKFENGFTLNVTDTPAEGEIGLIPGDVNGDGIVDSADKAIMTEAMEDPVYAEDLGNAVDFNRDGEVNNHDFVVFDNVPDPEEPDKDDTTDKEEGSGDSTTGGDSSGTTTPTPTPILPLPGAGSSGGGGGGGYSGGTSTPVVTTPAEAFSDLGNYEWAKESVYTLKNKGIISGTSATTFSPESNIKRGDFILILTRMLGITSEYSENFADVPSGSYYYDAIGKAKAAGIASGDGVNFNPENSITRQDLITLAYRAFLNSGYISEVTDYSTLDVFADKDSISDYATAPMASMVAAGIIKGSDGNVNPLGNATRAEVAVMCARLLALMN